MSAAPPVLLSDAEYRKSLSHPPAGYLLFGDEDYLKFHALDAARQAILDPAMASFNEIKLDALDYTPARLLDALTPLPVMAERKLITLTGMDLSAMRAPDVDKFCAMLETLDEYPHNCLVVVVPKEGIDVGYLPKRPSALFTRIAACLTPVRYDLVPAPRLGGWMSKHFVHGGAHADAATAAFLIDYCGRDMFTLAAEIDKLCCYVLAQGRENVTPDDVREVTCAGIEYDAFAFGNAVMEGRRVDALAALATLRHRRTDPILLLGELIRIWSDMLTVRVLTADGRRPDEIATVTKLHSYKVGLYQKAASRVEDARLRRAITLCAEADAALKLSPQGYATIEKLVCAL